MLNFILGVLTGMFLKVGINVLCWYFTVDKPDEEERPNIDDPGFS